VLAAYGRTEARDADDLARLVPIFGFERVLALADTKEASSLDRKYLAGAFRRYGRVPPERFPYPETAQPVQQYMAAIAVSLETGKPVTGTGPYSPN
jgi:hypothetical protein